MPVAAINRSVAMNATVFASCCHSHPIFEPKTVAVYCYMPTAAASLRGSAAFHAPTRCQPLMILFFCHPALVCHPLVGVTKPTQNIIHVFEAMCIATPNGL